MKQLLFRRSGDDFLPSVATLVSGTTVALGITYLARPILTRLYTPEMFGLLGVFTATVAVLTTISSGRYDDAVMLPEEDKKARSILFLGLTVLVGLTVATIPFAVYRDALAAAVGKPELAPYLILLPISLFCMGFVRLAEIWLTREKRFKAVAGGRAAQSASAVPAQLAAGLRGASAWGLIGGLVFGQAIAALALGVMTWRRLVGGAVPRLRELVSSARRYSDFPLFSGPSALLNATSSQLPAFLLFFFFDAEVVGHYAQAFALLAVPIGLIGSSVAQVFFVRAAAAVTEGGLDTLTDRVFRRLFELGLFPAVAVLVGGPAIFEFVLGPDWATAGVYARWIAAWLLFMFVASPLTRLFDVLERLRAHLAFNAGLFATRAAVLLIAGFLGRPLLAIALYGGTSAVLYAALMIWLLTMGGVKPGGAIGFMTRRMVLALAPSALVAIPVALEFSPAVIVGTACLAGLLYAGLLLLTHRRTREA